MEKMQNDFETSGIERMTDAELSKKLGHYQRTESIGILLGVLLVIAGYISMFIQRDPILVCALAFPGVALFLLVAKPAQKKKSADAAAAGRLLPHGTDKSLRPGAGAGHAAHRLGVSGGGKAVGGLLYGVYRDGLPRGRAQGTAVLRSQCGAAPHGGGKVRPRQRQLDDPNRDTAPRHRGSLQGHL